MYKLITDRTKSINSVANKLEFEATIVKHHKLYDVWLHCYNDIELDYAICAGTFDTFDKAIQACIDVKAIEKIHVKDSYYNE